jgi:hypothetical protein
VANNGATPNSNVKISHLVMRICFLDDSWLPMLIAMVPKRGERFV